MYVVERWLARMAKSPYSEDFILKGGMLLASLGARRATVDADTLARNMSSDRETVAQRVAEIAQIGDADDGVAFLVDTLHTSTIRDSAMYSGLRVKMVARLATAEVIMRLDINFGDPVTPAPRMVELPSLRPGGQPVRLLGYPIETVLAEKIVTAIELGMANTRVRDFADVFVLGNSHPIECGALRSAMIATATFRGASLIPLAQAVGRLAELRESTYSAYRKVMGSSTESLPPHFSDLVAFAGNFVDPVIGGLDDHAVWNPAKATWELS
jgi:hypothetical protein